MAAPHFDVPFRYHNGAPATNEQGSEADVAACVYAVCATNPGQFLDLLDFGLPDPTFTQEPIPISSLMGPINEWEPRASLLAETNPDAFEAAIVNANIQVRLA